MRSAFNTGCIFLVFLAPPAVVRTLLWFESGLSPSFIDLRGAGLDLAIGVLLAILAIWAGRAIRLLPAVIASFWLIVCVISYEFASQFDAFSVLNYAGYVLDPTFFFGSVVRIRHPLPTYIFLGVVIVSMVVLFWRMPNTVKLGQVLLVSLAGLVGLAFVPIDFEFDEWRQDSFLVANLASLLSTGPVAEVPRSPEAIARLERNFSPDLSGRLEEPSGPGRNVLLVILESVSGAYLPSFAREQGVASNIEMTKLDARANTYISFRNFVSQQRQTNRGEYAILCGDFPKLASQTARMSEFAFAATRLCLPNILQDAGYRTAYLQAAPLAFMTKDAFMQNIGYEDILGYQWFDRAYSRTGWGVDDRAFFERSLDEILDLEASGQPWFASLLTSGTHHPFNVPVDFSPDELTTVGQRAFAWLDDSFDEFIEVLEAKGILDNTLVVVTSDESAGISSSETARVRAMSQNWGFAIIQSPRKERRRVEDIFSQSDIGLSILDYLELAEKAPHFVGRSMFRTYDEERSVYYSNTYLRRSSMLTTSGVILNCSENGQGCKAWQKKDNYPFGPNAKSTAVSDLMREELAGAIAMSLEGSLDIQGDRAVSMQLIQPGDYSVPPKAGVTLFGGQYLTIEKNTQMEVDLSFEVLPGPATARIGHDVISSVGKVVVLDDEEMRGGEEWAIHYEFGFAETHPRLELRLPVNNLSEAPLRIRFNRASMTLKDGLDEGGQLVILENEIRHSAD